LKTVIARRAFRAEAVSLAMSLLVLSYPGLSPGDYAWIQSIRAEHDTQYEIVGPHFTFVFPVSGPDQEALVSHVRSEARGQARFSFALRCAVVVKDALSAYTHVCLAPDEEYSTMVKLHDRLYSGLLAAELRLDIPFLPHLTVGNNADAQICKRPPISHLPLPPPPSAFLPPSSFF
jgi:2'-5' RNA ligase